MLLDKGISDAVYNARRANSIMQKATMTFQLIK